MLQQGTHFWVCITFCEVRHGDSATNPDYYYYYYYKLQIHLNGHSDDSEIANIFAANFNTRSPGNVVYLQALNSVNWRKEELQ